MALYPVVIHAHADATTPAAYARHAAVRLAVQLNAQVTWDGKQVTPDDVCPPDCPGCKGEDPQQGPWETLRATFSGEAVPDSGVA